ncbi:MAG: type I restriction-modification enzyme R subunit C-terminal domain-containing protein, partial [Bacteroidota bacterium]
NENVVSEYTYEQSVTDGVNVPFDVFTIETVITQRGSTLKAKQYVDRREKLSRKKRWAQLDEDKTYSGKSLDKDVVNPSQIRNVLRAYKDALPAMFPDRYFENGVFEVPKTLIFAKTDSHADDIIEMVREVFGEGNDFCKKITYKIDDDPKSVLNRFRNSWAPRIAVTVDMIATGTDVKPLEVLLFMRDVRSNNYFEQMKGRGTRTINFDDLRKVTQTARHTKNHFVVVDAVGAIHSKKTDSRPLERKKSIPLKDLLDAIAIGAQDEDLFLSLANRLIRLNKQINADERAKIEELAGGKPFQDIVKDLLNAYDPDIIEEKSEPAINRIPSDERSPADLEEARHQAQQALIDQAAAPFHGELNEYIENVRKVHEQIIDTINQDEVIRAEFDSFTVEKAQQTVQDFTAYIETHKDEIQALSFFYQQSFQNRELTLKMVKEVLEKLKMDKPLLAPHYVWNAYQQVDKVQDSSPKNELIALVSLLRRVSGLDSQLTPYRKTVDKNFQNWVFKRHSGAGEKFTEEQMQWLRMMRDHIASSIHLDVDDLDYTPFDAEGGRGKMWELFGSEMETIMGELNEALVA